MKVLTKMTTSTKRTPFEEIVAEAAAVALELRRSDDAGNWRGRKVTLPTMRAEAVAAAKATSEQVAALRTALEADPSRFPSTWRFIRNCATDLAGPQVTTLSRLNASNPWLRGHGSEAAAPELAVLGSHPLEAVVVAVEEAGRRHPEGFGAAITDFPAHERRMGELRERLASLCDRGDREVSGADLQLEAWEDTPQAMQSEGYRRVFYRISGRAVIASGAGGTRGLVEWLLGRPEILNALGVKV